jgi:hypothetical protein
LTIAACKPIIRNGELPVFDKPKKGIPAVKRKGGPAPRRKPSVKASGWSKIEGASLSDEARASMAAPARVEEQPCPNCGQPMLAAWGSTCGNCRPRMASPKTMFMSTVDDMGMVPTPGISLGWFVVLSSLDKQHNGALLELTTPVTILSRGGQENTSLETWIDFNDKFISNGHALIYRPKRDSQDEAFTIRDREVPGPSANGTFVNSHKLVPGEVIELSEGDIVRVGRTELMFKSLWLSPSGKGGM